MPSTSVFVRLCPVIDRALLAFDDRERKQGSKTAYMLSALPRKSFASQSLFPRSDWTGGGGLTTRPGTLAFRTTSGNVGAKGQRGLPSLRRLSSLRFLHAYFSSFVFFYFLFVKQWTDRNVFVRNDAPAIRGDRARNYLESRFLRRWTAGRLAGRCRRLDNRFLFCNSRSFCCRRTCAFGLAVRGIWSVTDPTTRRRRRA